MRRRRVSTKNTKEREEHEGSRPFLRAPSRCPFCLLLGIRAEAPRPYCTDCAFFQASPSLRELVYSRVGPLTPDLATESAE